MATPAKPLFRQRFCRAPECRVLFFICSYCYRGQVYCSQACRQPVRRQQRREANRRHQQTLRGRVAHSRRQRAYRLRRVRAGYQPSENKVTDHSSQASLRMRPSRGLSSLDGVGTIGASRRRALWAYRGLVVCQFCDRSGQLVNTSG